MNNIISSEIGLVHIIAASLAMIFGSFVLADTKGTQFHRWVGYSYAVSMIVLNVTALLIYRLFGKFGIFHVAAIVSLLTLAAGMIPVILRKPKGKWLNWHFSFMYWSVLGLYAAFVAEVSVRFPVKTIFGAVSTFFIMVTIATVVTIGIGQIVYFKYKKKWANFYETPGGKDESLSTAKDSA